MLSIMQDDKPEAHCRHCNVWTCLAAQVKEARTCMMEATKRQWDWLVPAGNRLAFGKLRGSVRAAVFRSTCKHGSKGSLSFQSFRQVSLGMILD